MLQNYREFEAADPFGRTCKVRFVWLQTAISIRHADAVDVKFTVDDGSYRDEKVVAMTHPRLRAMAERLGRPLADAWVMKMAAIHLDKIIRTGGDIEKPLVTMSQADMDEANSAIGAAASA